MDMEQLLKMLGVSTGAEAAAAITRFNMMVEGVMSETGADSASEALSRFKQQRAQLSQIEQAVGAQGADALAKVEAFKAQAGRSSELEAQLNGLQKTAEKKSADERIGAAISEGRLPPAMKDKASELYAQHGLSVLDTYLAAFDKPLFKQQGSTTSNAPKQPKLETQQSASGDDEFSDEELHLMKVMSRTPEQMREARKLWTDTSKGSTALVPETHVRSLNQKFEKKKHAQS